jgi:hypothetical protein
MARSNISDIESQPSKTGSANISYSLGQEKEIVDQWINNTTGPPGFGPLSQEKEGVSQQPTATGFEDGFNLIHGGSCEDIPTNFGGNTNAPCNKIELLFAPPEITKISSRRLRCEQLSHASM